MQILCKRLTAEEALAKLALKPINRDRKAVAEQRKALAKGLSEFLAARAPGIADQLVDQLGLQKKARKPGADPEALAAAAVRARKALDALEFGEEWHAIVSVAEDPLAAMAMDGGAAALKQLSVKAEEVVTLTGDKAAAWGRARAAEMVGMKRNADGDLVPNPNAKWRIDDSTREMLRGKVEEALTEGLSADELKASILEGTAFSPERAESIARTEIAKADMAGTMEGYQASGLVAGKTWSTAQDDLVSEECQACEAAGVIGMNEDFPSGESFPPNHPNCRCTVLPVLTDEMPDTGKTMKDTTMKLIWSGAARENFHLNFPIMKTEKLDDGRLVVQGIATSEALDHADEIVDYESAKAAFAGWAGNIREQHDAKKAVGKAMEVVCDDDAKQIIVKAFISSGAQDTQAKVLDGTLAAFSIGGSVAKRLAETVTKADGTSVKATRVLVKRISETSVVDAGCNPESGICIVKAEGEDLVWAAQADDLKKGLYELSDFASILRGIGYLVSSAGWEAQNEGDNSPLPAALLDWLKTGVGVFQAMAAEECAELLANLQAAVPVPVVVDVIAAADAGGDLAKAGKRFSTSTKAALKSAHEACKAADKALADLGYDKDEDEEGEGEGDKQKADTEADFQKRATEEAEQVTEIAKAAGLELAEPTAAALTKAALTELVTLRKAHADLLAQPAAPKGVTKALVIGKQADRNDGKENEDPAPVVKADGAVDDVATLIKAAQARPIRAF
ncbi:hypothetical protein DBR47_14385 [Paucibacter sp. KBW04]|uniref:phage head morphogenesis protein n=1 Tax=Paucibacter sp. KBW04 TaxID=2153361 RepID=UPI000F5751D1|nr:phage minor head protein [Paucibacter sp. KBW04]RQO57976.1 hypothetical protein DBR47_14385 [Paucibacter sp. KBW04]